MRELNPTELKRLHRDWRRRTEGRLGLIVDGIQGPFNVGAIIRTAAAYRTERIWFTEHATGPENAKVGRTALGTERFLEVERVPTASDAAEAARSAGFLVVGVELADEARPLHQMPLRGNICFMVGNEDHGISNAGLQSCDAVGFLPQLGRVGSLNAATATSIAIYEWARQQWPSADGSMQAHRVDLEP